MEALRSHEGPDAKLRSNLDSVDLNSMHQAQLVTGEL